MGRAAGARRRELPRSSSRTCSSARRSIARSSPGSTPRAGLERDRAAAAHREARAQGDLHAGEPVRRAPLRRAVRARAHLLDERDDRRAELHPADRGRPRQLGDRLGAQLRGVRASRAGDRVLTTYNAGPFVAGAALDAFARIGVCHIPVGTGNSERVLLAIEQLRPDAVAAHAVVRRLPARARRPARLERAADPRRRRARRRRARRSGRRSRRAGGPG